VTTVTWQLFFAAVGVGLVVALGIFFVLAAFLYWRDVRRLR